MLDQSMGDGAEPRNIREQANSIKPPLVFTQGMFLKNEMGN